MPTEPSQKSTSLALTADDVSRLLANNSPTVIIDIADKIGDAYSHTAMKPNDSQATEQIFRLLMRDAEVRVRATLAEHVKSSTTLPRDIAMSMARDVEEVALPMLEFSEVFNDKDLLDLVSSSQENSKFVAIAKRDHVSTIVSDRLISKGNDEVASALVNNNGADLSEKGLEKIVTSFPKNDSLMEALSNRPQLPSTITEKLISAVSSTLSLKLKEKYKLPEANIEQEVEKTRESETLKLVSITHSQEDVTKLVNQLMTFQRLTPSIILSSLCQGNFCFFETSLARLSNIPVSNARTLISDRGDLGFRAIYNKSGLPDTLFPAVKLLLRVVRELDAEDHKPGSAQYTNRIVERILQYSEKENIENLSYIIALVRRNAQ